MYGVCIAIIILVAIWYALYEPIYTDSNNLKLKAKYNATSCNSKDKFCTFNDDTVLCYYKTVNNSEYFGNCYVIGESINAR